jgi:two-component system, sensor histidine kinase PdtaS
MSVVDLPLFTQCGLRGIDRVPYGMHACHFYGDRDQLVAALVPYFVAGLRADERCLWITAPPLPSRKAIQALRAAWDGADDAIQAGALRILDFEHWYASSGKLRDLDVVKLWLKEEERALDPAQSYLQPSTPSVQPAGVALSPYPVERA